ncbi:zinc metalloprotease HtpX [Candidatus Woesearchaeota archaeon]|nr:zinc metalloprotease HtpX [Candidatus Woesearchaeota archaeon]
MKNQLKTVLFLGILSGILLIIGRLIGGAQGLAVALVFAILMNVGSYFFSHKLILLMYRAKEVSKKDNPALHEMVEEICKEANIPKPKIYLVPTEAPNAFAAGPNPKKSVVAVTQGILKLLSKEELKGVLAHEVAHVKNRDILIATIAATMASVITYTAHMAQFAAMFGGGSRDENNGGGNVISLLLLAILAPLAAMLIQLAISRSREFIADETGARLIKKAEPLAKALEKLESGAKNHPLRFGSDSTNHMFIISPFRGAGKTFLSLFMTHPLTSDRCKRLRSLSI